MLVDLISVRKFSVQKSKKFKIKTSNPKWGQSIRGRTICRTRKSSLWFFSRRQQCIPLIPLRIQNKRKLKSPKKRNMEKEKYKSKGILFVYFKFYWQTCQKKTVNDNGRRSYNLVASISQNWFLWRSSAANSIKWCKFVCSLQITI